MPVSARPGADRTLTGIRLTAVVLCIYTVLALLVTWPMPLHFTDSVVGRVGGVDAYQAAWNLWLTAEALRSGALPFHTDLLYYPAGIDLFWQTLGFAQGIAALPITLTLGPEAAVNWTVLTSFVAAGSFTFLLARHLTRNTAAALIAGAIYAFSPYHMEKVLDGNLEVAALHWIPAYVFALHTFARRPAWLRGTLAASLLIWVSLGSWYYGMFCILYTGAYAVAQGLRRGRAGWRVFSIICIPVLIWGAVLAPRITSLASSGDTSLQDMRAAQRERSADPIDFILPNPSSPIWGAAVWRWREQYYPDAVIWNVALGYVGIGLGIYGMVAAWRRTWRWSILFGIALVLALGPELRVLGHSTGIPLPFAVIQELPGIRAAQRPNHMAVIASLMLALIAAYGVQQILARLTSPGTRQEWLVVAFTLSALVGIDAYAGPLTLVQRPIHPYYQQLAQTDGALLPLPLYININRSENLTPQTVHRRPILGGYVARPPVYPFAQYAPGVRELQYGADEPDDILLPGGNALARSTLAAYTIRTIVLDLTANKPEYFARTRAYLTALGLAPPIFHDDQIEVYRVPEPDVVEPVLYLGAGWRPLERQPGTAHRWRWIGERAEIRLYNPQHTAARTTIQIRASAYARPRSVQFELDGVNAGEVVLTNSTIQTVRLLLLVPPGEHMFALRTSTDIDPSGGNPIGVRVFSIASEFGFDR